MEDYKLFIASPSDVQEEREIIERNFKEIIGKPYEGV